MAQPMLSFPCPRVESGGHGRTDAGHTVDKCPDQAWAPAAGSRERTIIRIAARGADTFMVPAEGSQVDLYQRLMGCTTNRLY